MNEILMQTLLVTDNFVKTNCAPEKTYNDGCRSCTCGRTGVTAFCTWEKCDIRNIEKGEYI